MKNFNALALPKTLHRALDNMAFYQPTPIQIKAIPPALSGRDILGSAQTGTGKTAAFGIPLVTKLMSNAQSKALVLAPTRELATQVISQLQTMLGKQSNVKSTLLIGGASMLKQIRQLRDHPRLIVGTPGRINDHLERNHLKLHDTGFLVLDETDRMLDMGFTIQVEKIMAHMPESRQTLLFSATLSKHIIKISKKYLSDPLQVIVDNPSAPAKKIKHKALRMSVKQKYSKLTEQLDQCDGSIIVFVKTKYQASKLATKLSKQQYRAIAMHGDLRQNKRERVLAAFRKRKYRILVATDIAARGLDIHHIKHVINYDIPQCSEDYIHRVGRTARAGTTGSAMCFVTPADEKKWRIINKTLNPTVKKNKAKKQLNK
ncbi:MAG: DEAD/DEAH box helicase [Pseudomonadota bacterium]